MAALAIVATVWLLAVIGVALLMGRALNAMGED
jgi:hypothetical protein